MSTSPTSWHHPLQRAINDMVTNMLSTNWRTKRATKVESDTGYHGSIITAWNLRYHQTRVVSVGRDSFRLYTGGHATVTTKARMNAVLPLGWRVYQEQFDWYLRLPTGHSVRFAEWVNVRKGVRDGADVFIVETDLSLDGGAFPCFQERE